MVTPKQKAKAPRASTPYVAPTITRRQALRIVIALDTLHDMLSRECGRVVTMGEHARLRDELVGLREELGDTSVYRGGYIGNRHLIGRGGGR